MSDTPLPAPQGEPLPPPIVDGSSPAGAGVTPPPRERRSALSDGEPHRMHRLTPLLKGGLALLVIIGIIVANFRDQFLLLFFPGLAESWNTPETELVEFLLERNLVPLVLLGIVGILVLIVVLLDISWRFHTFRISGDAVEVRSGVIFRTHRRAPLDRVQGVNLIRPVLARLLGMAKLEVVGAGTDANVNLEYLSVKNAEEVRSDILRLASGRQLAAEEARAERSGLPATVLEGASGIIDGVDTDDPDVVPDSIVRIPPGRIVLSQVLSLSTIIFFGLVAVAIVGTVASGEPAILIGLIPALLGFGSYWVRQGLGALRYSIAPTPQGLRITFGLLTTTTQVLPPGRIHAVQVIQPLLWRAFGWWSIRVTRMSGASASQALQEQQVPVLPVGTRTDAERVLALLLPAVPSEQWAGIFERGVVGTHTADDPYRTTPRRGRWLRPLSWKRNGLFLAPDALFLRKGFVWRTLTIVPLARVQSFRVDQGPIDRRLNLANLTAHTVMGPIAASVGILEKDVVLDTWSEASRRAIRAAAADRSHRWDASHGEAESGTSVAVLAADAEAGPDAALQFTTLDGELPPPSADQLIASDDSAVSRGPERTP